ncbi:MAG: DUF4190 domain-containing protein [Acidobacteria bacterium]|nr:DUF4190 domain-containing protein [Acidobacteriota bacterium]MCA1636959.1 DUF4190 domain-containing protein [Acidobacteriota bacterium]
MKKCPTCDKTFDDAMRFCQLDGTLLVEVADNASDDPFKTMVGVPPVRKDELDSLQLPEDSYSRELEREENPPVSSPFDAPTLPGYQSPSAPPFREPEQTFGMQNEPFDQSPFGQQSAPYNPPTQQTDWTPPPAPVSNWQDQRLGVNTPFQPPVAGQGQNQTLAVVSLVTGILSVICCGAFAGIPAIVTGYMAKNNIDANPDQYTGRGMATAGMIMGGISILFTILYIVYILAIGFSGNF